MPKYMCGYVHMCVQVCEGAHMHACVLCISLCTVYIHMHAHVYGQLVLVSVHA